jgi:hypothetical protein
MKKLSKISKMKTSGNHVLFDLDRASGISLRGVPKDILAMIRRARREFYRDGATHTWITYNIIAEKNNKQYISSSVMDDSRALNTLSMIGNDSYLMRIKYITVNKAEEDRTSNNYVIRDYLNPIRKDNKTVIIDKYTSPGTLTGIDSHYYERDYPVTVTIYGLYKINKNPNIKKLAPMKTAVNLNCVEKRVIEHFTNATHGGKLTEKRRSAITSWGEQVRETGATIDDVKKLETLLRTPICIKTLSGEPLNTSKYNNTRTPIDIYDHNGHDWN